MEIFKVFHITDRIDASQAEAKINEKLSSTVTIKDIKMDHNHDGSYLMVVVLDKQLRKTNDNNTD